MRAFRKPLLFLVLGLVISLVICQFSTVRPYSEQLIYVQTEEDLSHIDKRILNEPAEVQSVLLDYSTDSELVLKAWIALSKYPEKARQVLLLYGSEPEFKEILKNYGESVIPAIQYFLENDVWSVKAIAYTTRTLQSFADSVKALWNRISGATGPKPDSAAAAQPSNLGPIERGWYAVNFIKTDGHNFLGQFVVDKDGRVKWNQTARVGQGVISFFTSGVRTLETKYDLGEAKTAGDYFWAGLDVAVVAAPFKLLKAGKVVEKSGKALPLTTRTRLFAPRLISKATIFQKLGKYGAIAATAYIIIAHPSLVNSLFAELANLMGWNPLLVQFAGWAILVLIALYPISWLLIPIVRFAPLIFSIGKRDRYSVRRA
jgi:hypothetical protein